MNRVIVFLLSALDAVVQAAIGLALVAASITIALVFGGSGWSVFAGVLWPATGAIWQLGNLVPQPVVLPDAVLAATGLPAAARAFTVGLAPLGLALITVGAGLRSGSRSARAGAPGAGIVAGVVVAAAISTGVALTARSSVVATNLVVAAVMPVALYTVALVGGAAARAWREGGWRPVDAVRDRLDAGRADVAEAVRAGAIGAAVAVAALVGLGAIALGTAIFARGGAVIALFQSAATDGAGAIALTLAQAAYLPTLVVWAAAWMSGAGFQLGADTGIGPVSAHTGVVPGVPLLAAIPPVSGGWWLCVVVLVVAAGALAGWIARTVLVRTDTDTTAARGVALAITALSAGVAAAVLALAASGGIGPGSLAHVGPDPLVFGGAVLIEVGIGAGILLLSPRGESVSGEFGRSGSGRDDSLRDADAGPRRNPDDARTDETAPIV